MNLGVLTFAALAVLSPVDSGPPRSGLIVDVSSSRSAAAIEERVESAVRQFGANASRLTAAARSAWIRSGRYNPKIPFSLPVSVHLEGLPPSRSISPKGGGGLTLVFDSSGPRAFPTAYRQLLQDTFTQAQATINAVFGPPSLGGNVRVLNFDADIGDRDAVVGGYYVHNNGSGEREIRFPVYGSPEAASVNFVHTLLLAYLGGVDYGYDAFSEGLVRAATMRIARTANALPASLDPQVVESVLDNTYDVGTFYDWFNQRPLGGAKFIASNLRDVPLPVGGSLGGIYLLRYQMSGSAWQKVLAAYPGFASAYNQALYASPNLQGDVAGLVQLAQTTIDALAGGPNATVEGLSFADWFTRQHILETRNTRGQKLLVQPIPLPPIGGTSDFGVYLVQATFFETRANGDEILLGGTSYPIFWTTNFDRIFPSVQEDVMPIAGAYGSVAPNFPNLFGGQAYRVAIDIPVLDKIARTYVPAGAVATGSNTTENDFYGTISGVAGGAGVSVRVRLTIGSTVFDNIPAVNGAFGTRINQSIFLNSARLKVEVIRQVTGNDTVVLERFVNKGPGPLALDLRTGNGEASFDVPGGLPKGLSLLGIPVDPYAKTGGDLLQIAEDQVLAAHYNAARAAYDIYPDTGPLQIGGGYFVRTESALGNFSIPGRTHPGTPVAIALRPGWNLISNPLPEGVTTDRITVVRSTDLPKTYAEAVGSDLGTTFFQFLPGAPDAATGAPETGTLDAATQFEPGKGYFVRVLVPEGVTLLFEPANFATFGPQRSPRAKAAVQPPAVSWKLGLELFDGPHRARSYLGQTPTATAGFDRKEDSGLPPSLGGMQVYSENGDRMYVDMRATGREEVWQVRLTGLTVGKQYRLKLTHLLGRRDYSFFDPDNGIYGIIRQDWAYYFRARRANPVFTIRSRGSW